ncbi:hypothetical protein V1515DRAFT_598031 [Lipomyces mesembrius]
MQLHFLLSVFASLPTQFLADVHYGILTPDHWETYSFMFEESGFEVYESVTNEYICNGIYDEIGAPERRALTCKEILESQEPDTTN